MQFVFAIAIIGTVAACGILVYAFAGVFSNFHPVHPTTIQEKRAINVENNPLMERGGEARYYSRLKINNNFMDDMNSCHLCSRIIYTPGEHGKAGIAYLNDKLDLNGYQRIVFFARGQQGGEVVSFIAIGKSAYNPSTKNVDTFPNQDFVIMTKNVTLGEFWKRYEISIDKTKLADVTHPFGFVITGHESGVEQIFYLKGVTFDSKPAVNPLPLVNMTSGRLTP
jgi:hypothetical protein